MNGIIGYNGFVGKNIISQAAKNGFYFDEFYNSSNIEDIRGKSFDTLVCAGLSSLRWLANKEPEKDLASVNSLIENLKHVNAKKVILISTIDVYPNPDGENEDSPIDLTKQNPYGKHRHMFETFVREKFDTLAIRMPILFGDGLKKNVIYDFIHDNETYKIDSEAVFEFYDLKHIWIDIQKALTEDIAVLNMATEPFSIKEMVRYAFGKEFDNIPANMQNQPIAHVKYHFTTKHFGSWDKKSPYLYSKQEVLADIKSFVEKNQKSQKSQNRDCELKLAASSMGWNNDDESMARELLSRQGLRGLEVTPDRFLDDNGNWNESKIADYVSSWKKHGVEITTIQGILFPKNDLKLFESEDSRKEMLNHIKHVISESSKTGAKELVFGAPKNRKTNGLPKSDIDAIALPFFREIADFAYRHGMIFCIEHLPKEYDTDYINTIDEAMALARKISHPGFGINIDAGALILSGEDPEWITKARDYIGHYHISQPLLVPFDDSDILKVEKHKLFASALKKIGYDRWISVEMKKSDRDSIAKMDTAINTAKKIYLE